MAKEPAPDAQNYIAQANSMRALAARASSVDAKNQLLHLADLYEKLAQVAEDFVLRSLSAAAAIATSDVPASKSSMRDNNSASAAPVPVQSNASSTSRES